MSKLISLSVAIVFFLLISALLIIVLNFSGEHTGKMIKIRQSSLDSLSKARLLPVHDTVIYLNKRKIVIKIPKNKKKSGSFLVLHGWNFPPEDWCTKTSLCDKATENGFYMVMPDMGKSIYHNAITPVTRPDWRGNPTRKWLTDTLIPFLQKNYALFSDKENNFIVGLSTGARGVALVLLDLPSLFKGAAALSGDYNQSDMPNDKLSTGYYGAFKKFKNRWDTVDNPLHRIREFSTPLYLGHGTDDKIVPPRQTKVFYDSLVKYHPKLKIKLNMPKACHDYQYWRSEVDNILTFFSEIK